MPTGSSLANPIKSFERELLVVLVDFENSFVEFIREVPNLKDRENQQRGQTKRAPGDGTLNEILTQPCGC